MSRPSSYSTKHREAVLNYMSSLNGAHITAAQIIEHFKNTNSPVGRTTVFRLLDKLTESGEIRRFTNDGISGACYQFVGEREDCHTHLHLKCEGCGELLHLECGELKNLSDHMRNEHAFKFNAMKTVLYGQCENCARALLAEPV